MVKSCAQVGFQSTLPAREATIQLAGAVIQVNISIHASREGSDWTAYTWCRNGRYFNPRFPRGKRHDRVSRVAKGITFQSTLPAGEATLSEMIRQSPVPCQSTLPAGEATDGVINLPWGQVISIHASRGGSDCRSGKRATCIDDFNPRFPRGKRLTWLHGQNAIVNFNPRFPRGKRRLCSGIIPGII